MYLKSVELTGFKSFGKKTQLVFSSPIVSIVGPNGSGKSNVADGFRFVLGEQSMKSMRGKKGEDMIWGGSPGLSRQNRGSVKLAFDNTNRLLDIDFDEVLLERVVYRDGQNEYLLNGTQVRLKDVIRLLAGAHIGGSGYQIISQGEADRVLNASPKERREMLEDALGLKLYQHKKAESERKLEETAVNIEKTRSLRREIAPHLNFLRHQVEKIEKARDMKEEFSAQLSEYLAREDAYLTQESVRIQHELHDLDTEQRRILEQLQGVRHAGGSSTSHASHKEFAERAEACERELQEVRRRSEGVSRELGRAEGALQANSVTVEQIVAVPHVRGFARELDTLLQEAERRSGIDELKASLREVRERIRSFVDGLTGTAPVTSHEARLLVDELSHKFMQLQKDEHECAEKLDSLRKEGAQKREAAFAAERESLALGGELREIRARITAAEEQRSHITGLRQRFEEEVREAVALLGSMMRNWKQEMIPEGALFEPRSAQDKRRRDIERLKIKIEESGIAGGDAVVKEFNQTKSRDEFLAKELGDLETSAESLKGIIADLERTLDERFKDGLQHINAALKEFFAKLFGGGEAMLKIEQPRTRNSKREDEDEEEDESESEEEEIYAGLSVFVQLPRKKVHTLEVLSGGERALTSIALIFAMSQVNPPPFLILDETDAALDEANSKRYADMIKELGKKSQLIVITHNRATMAAAGELYGVTMGQDGVSKLLSVKLEEAERVAK